MAECPAPVQAWRLAGQVEVGVQHLAGRMIAVEGIDQAGKWTVCERLASELRAAGIVTELTGFPDYGTPLGGEIRRFLVGERRYPPEVRQLLYVANRWERAGDLRAWLDGGRAVVVDRYIASGIAYGTAHGLDADWMNAVECGLPAADLTILLDIAPEVSVARKSAVRDVYEGQVDLLRGAREAFLRLADDPDWCIVDGDGDRDVVWGAVLAVVRAWSKR